MRQFFGLSAAALLYSMAGAAHADAWRIEGGIGATWLEGSSNTTDGGAAFAGGGVVHDISFDQGESMSVGVRRDWGERLSFGVSYDRIEADLSFGAEFVNFGNSVSRLTADATSDVVMFNAAYTMPLAGAWSLEATAGVGVAFNTLDNIDEDYHPADGVPDTTVTKGEETALAARLAARVNYAVTDTWNLYGEVSATRLGEFSTGDTRVYAPPEITPYKLEAWGGGLTLGIAARF